MALGQQIIFHQADKNHGLRKPRESFYFENPKLLASADKLGRKSSLKETTMWKPPCKILLNRKQSLTLFWDFHLLLIFVDQNLRKKNRKNVTVTLLYFFFFLFFDSEKLGPKIHVFDICYLPSYRVTGHSCSVTLCLLS